MPVGVPFPQFAIEMDKAVKHLTQDQFTLAKRRMAFDLLRGIILSSPVGNPELWKSKPPPGYVGGRFRGAWIVTLDFPTEAVAGTIDASGAGTLVKGVAAITMAGPFQSIWISNNMPYAMRLERGHSTQAPPGAIVAANVQRINSVFARL